MVLKFFGGFKNFLYLCLVDPLDIAEVLFSGHDDAGNCAIPTRFKFGHISGVDTTLLKLFNLKEGSGLDFFRDLFDFFLSNLFFFFGLFFLLHVKKSKIKNRL